MITKKLLRQFIQGVFLDYKRSPEFDNIQEKAKEIMFFMTEHNLLNPNIKDK